MKTFVTNEKRSAPAVRKARPYVHHPIGPVQQAQQAEIRRILRSIGAQAKLTIGQPNDKYEQEADRVADQVMAMPDPGIQRQPPEDEEDLFQAKATPGHTPQVAPNVAANIQSLKGGGQPLADSTRSFFEPRFGQDFSRVRIHTDSKAAAIAQSVDARAYTLDNNIVFNAGQYAPNNHERNDLLAHELMHVVQQSGPIGCFPSA